ncbi:nucleotidyltransferase family protein [Flavisphingomonas formosensis]|uniref:nucleotidyltransferase family protein n=1 Tax=Flavisphingomonas formosensis TaxID=861534 RepID=UPI0012FBE2BB|nr:nucleotidyltransferase family protein [Sphingomonas formosensis]
MRRTALLLAGSRPGIDRLAAMRGGRLKALVPVAGRPMVARVAETLLSCPEIGRVRVLTQDVDAIAAVLPADERISFAISGGGISNSIAAIAGGPDAPWPIFVTTADHVLLRPETISTFLSATAGVDVAVGVVERKVVQSRFPDSKRTWLRFRGGQWTGANLFAFNGVAAREALAIWSEIEADRKKGWKLILRFGPMLLLRALTRTITLEGALDKAGRKLGVRVKPVALSDPLAAVDVDKLADLELAEEVLSGRA